MKNNDLTQPKFAANGSSTRRYLGVGKILNSCFAVLACLLLPGFAGAATITLTRTSAFDYDATTGLLTKEIVEPTTSTLCLVKAYTYDTFGNKTAATVRNCNGSAATFPGASAEAAAPTGFPVIVARTNSNSYDAGGQFPAVSSNALGQNETKTYDPKYGGVTSLTGPNGLTTTWTYDSFGRKTSETRADGTQTSWAYQYCTGINGGTANCPTVGGAAGAWVLVTTPLASDGTTQTGPISKTYFDSLDREIRTETQGFDGSGASTVIYKDTQYDSLGRSYMTSRPYYAGQTIYWTTTTYDGLGRPILATQPDTSTTSIAYNGLVTTVTNANSQTRVTTKNSQGQVISVKDANNQTLTYTYNPFGNLTQTQDPLGNVITLTYDLRGRKTQMVDPDMGTWTYVYDALGQLVSQTDAKSQTSTLTYDKLGRLTNRSEADLISNWYYDQYKDGSACNKGVGKLCQAETSTGYNRSSSYDSLGRPVSTTTTIDTTYTESVTYDSVGRVATKTYPGGQAIKYGYTTLGYLKELRDNTSNALYWQATTLDAEAHLLLQTYGNGVQTTQTYNATNGRITAIQAGAGNGVQNFTYQYDALGNITTRTDANDSLTETFVYDSLNRLTSGTVNSSGAGIVTQSFTFDALGNITSKSDLGTYTYNPSGGGSVRPHALTRVNLTAGGYRTYQYDANGNLTTETQYDAGNNVIANKGRVEFYTSFNMPTSMGSAAVTSAFYYGPEHQRVKQNSSVQGATFYLNPGNNGDLSYEKDVKLDGTIEQRSFITAYGQVVAVIKQITSGATTTTQVRYFHRDNLGSTTTVTDETGALVERLAYEAFGKRRFATGVTDPNGTIVPLTTDRGFTNHEEIDSLGLVHMNGRIYDPVLGRFMSADPTIPDPSNLQSYNRYAYVINSPLILTDPSGYSWWTRFRDNILRPVAAIVVAIYAPEIGSATGWTSAIQTATGWSAATANGIIGGALAGGISGGNLQSAITGAISGGAFGWTGDVGKAYGLNSVGNFAAHAAAGCLQGALGGGGCGRGALSGMASMEGAQYGFIGAIVAGGTASVIGGGKFSNGAAMSAFSYLIEYGGGSGRGALNTDGAQTWISDESTQASIANQSMQIAQLPPTIFLAEPPLDFVPGRMTPLEELPIGETLGPGAGKVFPRNNPYPEGTPCTYCGKPTTREPGPDQLNNDHIVPKAQGGNNTPNNSAPACRTCNLKKGNRTPTQWYLDNGWTLNEWIMNSECS